MLCRGEVRQVKKVKYKIMAALILSGLLVACFIGGYSVYSTMAD